jgi:hypothetical protein
MDEASERGSGGVLSFVGVPPPDDFGAVGDQRARRVVPAGRLRRSSVGVLRRRHLRVHQDRGAIPVRVHRRIGGADVSLAMAGMDDRRAVARYVRERGWTTSQ